MALLPGSTWRPNQGLYAGAPISCMGRPWAWEKDCCCSCCCTMGPCTEHSEVKVSLLLSDPCRVLVREGACRRLPSREQECYICNLLGGGTLSSNKLQSRLRGLESYWERTSAAEFNRHEPAQEVEAAGGAARLHSAAALEAAQPASAAGTPEQAPLAAWRPAAWAWPEAAAAGKWLCCHLPMLHLASGHCLHKHRAVLSFASSCPVTRQDEPDFHPSQQVHSFALTKFRAAALCLASA